MENIFIEMDLISYIRYCLENENGTLDLKQLLNATDYRLYHWITSRINEEFFYDGWVASDRFPTYYSFIHQFISLVREVATS